VEERRRVEQEFDQELVLEKQVKVYRRLVEERCPQQCVDLRN